MQAPLPRRAKGPSAIAAASAAARPSSGSESDSATDSDPEATSEAPPPMSRTAARFVADLAVPRRDQTAATPATATSDTAGTTAATPRPPARRRLPRAALVAGVVVVAAALIGGTFLVIDDGDTRPSASPSAPGQVTNPDQGGGPYYTPPTGTGSTPPPSTTASASPSPDGTSASSKPKAKAKGSATSGSTHTTAPPKSSATKAGNVARTDSSGSDDGPSCTSAAGSGPITGYSTCVSSGTVTFRATFHASQPYYHVFINTDGNTSTGYQLPYPSPSALGADYMIENGHLYRSRSTDWSWSEASTDPTLKVSGSTRTWTLSLSGIGSPANTQRIEFHAGSDYTPVITFSPK